MMDKVREEEECQLKKIFKFFISIYFKNNIEPTEITYGIVIKAFGKKKDLL